MQPYLQLSLVCALGFGHDARLMMSGAPTVPAAARGRLRPSTPTGPCVAEPLLTATTIEVSQRARAQLERGARHVSLDAFGCEQVRVDKKHGVRREETWVFSGALDGGPGEPRLASFVEVGAREVTEGQLLGDKVQVTNFLAKPDGGLQSSVTTVWLAGVASVRYSQNDLDGTNSELKRFSWDGGWALVEQYETPWNQR